MTLALSCRECGRETDSENSREAVCFLCLGRTAIASEMEEMRRLALKLERYTENGHVCSPEQFERVVNRAQRHLLRVLPVGNAAAVWNAIYEEFHASVSSAARTKRGIYVPRRGEFLVRQ